MIFIINGNALKRTPHIIYIDYFTNNEIWMEKFNRFLHNILFHIK